MIMKFERFFDDREGFATPWGLLQFLAAGRRGRCRHRRCAGSGQARVLQAGAVPVLVLFRGFAAVCGMLRAGRAARGRACGCCFS
jgi:hypothetical protein